ncbi:MAG: translation initiation factor eIF-2B alpha subunit [Lasallia pustulata]|uniref:Translation initiation factor eIF2B subunit alpha n=1 Tax=Lasallia pustulata TaxID=136370 RepID=A0A5M8PK72_9LECA|nr:MAG: translation initiation factor eIF-2B alpha subunit [Lasallia pustulata]
MADILISPPDEPSKSPSTPLTPDPTASTTPPSLPGNPPTMTRMASTGDVSKPNGKPPFDIVTTYLSLLASDPDLTMPIAAIDSLILLLSQSTSTTISETLSLLATSTSTLKHAIPNPISLSAGTDLFQRYLITTLQRPERPPHPSDTHGHDFRALRNHLLSNGRLFVQRAKESRAAIARFGKSFVRDGSVVLTNGGSRVVGALLKAAAEDREGSVRFRVIYVLGQCASGGEVEGAGIVRELRRSGVPVATVPEAAVAYSMGKVDVVIVGAEGVVENGGVISRLGTFQIGVLARSAGKPFYVVAESHKFVRLYPLGQYDLPIEQKVVDFTTVVAGDEEGGRGDEGGEEGMRRPARCGRRDGRRRRRSSRRGGSTLGRWNRPEFKWRWVQGGGW